MFGTSALNKVRGLANRFVRADGGNIAILFAFALVPLLSLVGAAVDYARTATARSAMQAAMDSTALMLAKDLNSGVINGSDINSKAQSYFSALFNNPEAKGVSVAAIYMANNGSGKSTINVTGSGYVTTDFMKVAGFPQMPFDTQSTSTWGNTKLRVALALDNTGSMAQDGKMDALIPAAKNLIDQLKTSAANPGDVYISVIPFATDVNIGTSFKDSLWMDWSQWADNGSIEDGWQCDIVNNKNKQKMICGNIANNVNKWNGCVMDRAQNYDTLKDAPNVLVPNSYLAADQSAWCPVQIMPLSYNWTALKDKIDSMTPNGNTNQAIGLAWGWFSLNQSAPLNAPAEDPTVKYEKVIILMTDGINTQNRFTSSQSQIDARQATLCNNVKADKITIYTVQVNTSGDPTQSVLQNCASGPDKFFVLTSANQIMAAFGAIGASLSKLRIAN